MTQTLAEYCEEFRVKLKAGLADEVHVSVAHETAKPCAVQVVVQAPFDSAGTLSPWHETPN
jgi:hypothetical protein